MGKEKEKYKKPTLEKVGEMIFMFESIKCFKPKQDINCPTSCAHHAPLGCRQCSGCHGCR